MDAFERFCVDQQFLFAGAARGNVHGGPEPHLGALAVEDELHIAGALEFLKNHVVHATAGFNEHRGDDGERAGLLGLASGGEELTGFFQGADVEAAGAGAAGVARGIVRAGQAGDRIDKQHDVAPDFDEPFRALDAEVGDPDMILDLFIVG